MRPRRTDSPADVNTLIRPKSFPRKAAPTRGSRDPPHALARGAVGEARALHARPRPRRPRWLASPTLRGETGSKPSTGNPSNLGGVRLPPSRSIRDGAWEQRTCPQHLRAEVRRLVNLARELSGADGRRPGRRRADRNQVLVGRPALPVEGCAGRARDRRRSAHVARTARTRMMAGAAAPPRPGTTRPAEPR